MSSPSLTKRPYVLSPEEGDAHWFAGGLMVAKTTGAETQGHFELIDQFLPPNYAAPRHIHRREDEAWWVLEGDATFFCGDEEFEAAPGSFVFLPMGIEHTFKVGPAGARLLTMAAPSGFADFVKEAGEPAAAPTLPPPGPMDVERLAQIAATYGIEITGPPPD
jgi:mannose-6-phosphate isomerase-like protein (cupin superfamily)